MESPVQPDPAFASSMRQISRAHFGEIWRRGRAGEALTGEDAAFYQTMQEHPEYADFWEHAAELGDREIRADGENPFLHVAMHTVIERQIAERNPPEADQALFRLTRAGVDRHDALHQIARVFSGVLWELLREGKPFDTATYRRRLRAIKP
jgi:Domain of unknown function (DUF1841)